MEGNSPAPDDQPEPIEGGTPAAPAAEPAAPPAPEPAADQSAAAPDFRIAQSEYTEATQTIAWLRAELGLERKAPREQVRQTVSELRAELEELRALKERVGEEAPPPPDPRYAELEERAKVAEFRVQEAIYSPIFGQGITTRVIELANALRTTDVPEELMGAVAAFMEAHRPTAAPADSSPPPAAGEPAKPPADIGLSEGDQGPSARPSPSAGRGRESGVVSAVRDIFAGAQAAARR